MLVKELEWKATYWRRLLVKTLIELDGGLQKGSLMHRSRGLLISSMIKLCSRLLLDLLLALC